MRIRKTIVLGIIIIGTAAVIIALVDADTGINGAIAILYKNLLHKNLLSYLKYGIVALSRNCVAGAGSMEMKKDGKNKLRMLYLKEILERRSDCEQGISHEEIMQQLKLKGIDVHPRTLRDDLYCLRDNAADFDMTIENNIQLGKSKAHPIKYMITKRLFSTTEVKLLMEAVKGIHSLSKEQTEILHRKLECLCSHAEAVKMRRSLAVVGGFKAYWSKKRRHDVLLTNLELVDRALEIGNKIEFRYYWYSMKKEPTYPRKKDHTHMVSPLVRVLEKGFYYLVCLDEAGHARHFRMDRITNLIITDEKINKRKTAMWEKINWENYVNSSFGLGLTVPYEIGIANPYKFKRFGENRRLNCIDNREYSVHLRLTRDLVGVVMDRFGSAVTITPDDKGHFIAIVKVYHNALFVSWILSLGNKVTILEPEKLVDDVAYYARSTGRWHKRVKGD